MARIDLEFRRMFRKLLRWKFGPIQIIKHFVIVLSLALLFQVRNVGFSTARAVPDALPVWTGEEYVKLLRTWSNEDRTWYVVSQLALDFVFPIAYGILFLSVFRILLKLAKRKSEHPGDSETSSSPRVHRAKRHFRKTVFTMILVTVITDFVENAMAIAVIQILELSWAQVLAWIGIVASIMKWTSVTVLLIMMLALLLVPLYRFVRSLRNNGRRTLRRVFQLARSFLAHLVELRFPLLFLALLLVWGIAAIRLPGIHSIAANVLLTNSTYTFYPLALLNGIAIIFLVGVLRALHHRFRTSRDASTDQNQIRTSERVSTDHEASLRYHTGGWRFLDYMIVIAVGSLTPMSSAIFSYHEGMFGREHSIAFFMVQKAFLTIAGLFSAIVVMFSCGFLMNLIWATPREDLNFFPGESLPIRKRTLKTEHLPHDLRYFHHEMTFFSMLLLVGFIALPFFENSISQWLSIPFAVVHLLLLTGLIASFAAFWLDGTRIPITFLFIVLVLVARFFGANHYLLPTMKPSAGKTNAVAVDTDVLESSQLDDGLASGLELLKSTWDFREREDQQIEIQHIERTRQLAKAAIGARMQASSNKTGTAIVVTCPGGGIHAAAWSSLVLEKLDQAFCDFSDSVCVISGVSGGSVGSMFFSAARYDDPLRPISQKLDNGTWKLAAESSLDSVARGVVFHDLPSLIFPFLRGQDRGLRLESALQSRLKLSNRQPTLNNWGQLALEGKMPVVVFNATDAVSGRRILFGSLPSPSRETLIRRIGKPIEHRELIPSTSDMHVATAARASASFPFVSPFTQPDQPTLLGKTVAIGDGGYIDNEGVVTAIDWIDLIRSVALDKTMVDEQKQPRIRRILLIRIQPSPDIAPKVSPPSNNLFASMRWLSGPIEALVSMRSSSQVERGQIEIDLAQFREKYAVSSLISSSFPSSPAPQELWRYVTTNQQAKKGNFTQPPRTSYDLQTQIYQRSQMLQESILGKGIPSVSPTEGPQESEDVVIADDGVPKSFEAPEVIEASDEEDTEGPTITVVPFTYISAEDNEPPPLNWSLSQRQLDKYEKVWQAITSDQNSTMMPILNGLLRSRK